MKKRTAIVIALFLGVAIVSGVISSGITTFGKHPWGSNPVDNIHNV